MQERLNVSDHLAVLSIFVNKIVANLQLRAECSMPRHARSSREAAAA